MHLIGVNFQIIQDGVTLTQKVKLFPQGLTGIVIVYSKLFLHFDSLPIGPVMFKMITRTIAEQHGVSIRWVKIEAEYDKCSLPQTTESNPYANCKFGQEDIITIWDYSGSMSTVSANQYNH
eukprot:m.111214 g.111214  ORF g.111214 m.111214 type:complete len:121 (-) comp14055_c0_seq10:750-1112(-)